MCRVSKEGARLREYSLTSFNVNGRRRHDSLSELEVSCLLRSARSAVMFQAGC